jgi:glycine oxidase ThiO
MSIAWQLSRSGAAVTVFDAGRIGSEASWAGAGMLAPGGELSERSRLAGLAMESLRLFPGFVSELSLASGLAVDFRQCGAFSLAYSGNEAESLRALAVKQSLLGIYSEQFSPSRVPGVRDGAVAAQYYPDDALVNPRDMMRALVVACRRENVTLHECEPVREITESSQFDITVLSAGAWSDQVKIVLAGEHVSVPEVSPVRGHLISFDLTGANDSAALCDVMVRHNHTYLLRRSGNVIIAGATTERCGFDRKIDGYIAEHLAASAAELMPALAHRGYAAWNGFRPATLDEQPVIQRLGNSSIWLAYGHYRNGILLAPATARLVAQEINQASSRTDSLLPAALPR